MLLIERRHERDGAPVERLVLPFDARCRSRLRTRLASGEEAGLFLPAGSVLRGGDLLQGGDGRVVEVVAAPEPLLEARSPDGLALARAAFHLGNRHVPVELAPGRLRCAADHVLARMLRGLGLDVTEIEAPFEPESGAYGHGHGETTPGARIHQYRRDGR